MSVWKLALLLAVIVGTFLYFGAAVTLGIRLAGVERVQAQRSLVLARLDSLEAQLARHVESVDRRLTASERKPGGR